MIMHKNIEDKLFIRKYRNNRSGMLFKLYLYDGLYNEVRHLKNKRLIMNFCVK